tara:strand:+ start:57 stop:548 length:492 start_codon:yes stop_codon:yes gene_type:complete
MRRARNTALWIGVGVAVVGIALLIFLPKKPEGEYKDKKPRNPFRPDNDDFGSSGGATSNNEVGCGGKYKRQGFPLRKNSCGSEVAKLQAYLNNEGAALSADGKFGALTKSAVEDNQKSLSEANVPMPSLVLGEVSKDFYETFVVKESSPAVTVQATGGAGGSW